MEMGGPAVATETIRRAALQSPTAPPAIRTWSPQPRWASDGGRDERRRALWDQHWSEPSRGTRNALLTEYLPLVARTVQRVPAQMRMHQELGDLESYGVFGLMDTIARFDASSSPARFPAYAAVRIRGAIFDELRRLDWLPRSTRRRVAEFAKASEALTGSAGRTPERREVLAAMGAGEREARSVDLALPMSQLLSLNAASPSSDSDAAPLGERLAADPEDDPEHRCIAVARRAALRDAFAGLSDRQRTVLDMHMVQQRTQSEIGEVLGVTNCRISQLEARAIAALREEMQRSGWMPPPELLRP